MHTHNRRAVIGGLAVAAVVATVNLAVTDHANAADHGIGTATTTTEPYGPYRPHSCPGALPGSDTGVVCEAHGWIITRQASIGPNRWLRWTDGPRDCANEDSPGPCYWDAAHRGNGDGESFWRTRSGRTIRLRTAETVHVSTQ